MADSCSTFTSKSSMRSAVASAAPEATLNTAQTPMKASSARAPTASARAAVQPSEIIMAAASARRGSSLCTRGPPSTLGAMTRARMTEPARGEVSPKQV